ncbi:MAG: hypothetical protein HY023_02995, partial [Chloroflexi bacterium]|nr:hypothetical protein [Chloroflexota bacterium]
HLSLFAAAIASALMVAFPFAAPVVPLVASEFHLLATAMTLGAVLCALEFCDTRRYRWAALGFAVAALAPFEHESGVVTGALMGLAVLLVPNGELEIANSQSSSSARQSRPAIRISRFAIPLLALATNLAYLPWWAHIPKTRAENFTWVGWESLFQSTVFFAEGLTFPLQFPARWLMDHLGWTDIVAVSVLAVIALGFAIFTLHREVSVWDGSRFTFLASRFAYRLLAFVFGYWLIAAAPSLFGLPFSYNIVSPRLQVFPSPAAVVLWSAVISLIAHRLSPIAYRLWPDAPGNSPFAIRHSQWAILITCLVLVPPSLHILRSVELHHYALDPLWTLGQAARDYPTEKQLILNPPNWVAPVWADYALGHEGVEIMPAYLSPQLMAWAQTGIKAPVDGLAFPNVFQKLRDHYFEAWGKIQEWDGLAARVPQYDRVWLWRYTNEGTALQEVGAVRRGEPTAPQTFVASFDRRVWLTQARAEIGSDEARVELRWHSTGPTSEDVFTHVFDCAGNVLGLADGAALGGTYPLWLWPAGVTVRDVRHIPLSTHSADGCYQIEIGLFSPADGARPPTFDQNGERYQNDAVVIKP